MTDHEVSRRSVLKASAWSVPIIAVAAAVPAAAASMTGQWAIANLQARFLEEQLPGASRGFDGFYLSVNGDVTSVAGPLPEPSLFTLDTDSGDSWTWFYPADRDSFPISTFDNGLSSLNATTLTITAPDGTVLGPYAIDRSRL